jgi:site-specific recombinase XerD
LGDKQDVTFEVLDEHDQPIPAVAGFMRYLRARGCSPNTLSAYAFDLLHFMKFLQQHQLTVQDFTPAYALTFLEYLSTLPSRKHVQRMNLVLTTQTPEGEACTRLSPATLNRIIACVSSFYEYLILSDQFAARENPIEIVDDPAFMRVSERYRPFMGRASRQRPIRRAVHVKTVQRVPRPMDDEQIEQLLASFHLKRDRAMILLMLHGGLRPGEVLNLQLGDLQYGRKRVIIRCRNEHPAGVRAKSRTERVVDLLQPETLQVVSDYVMQERPTDSTSPYVFLVGGRGTTATLSQPLAISGLGGIGKTQTAVEYAYRYQDEHDMVLWINTSTPEDLIEDMANLAIALDLAEEQIQGQTFIRQAVKYWLATHTNWVLGHFRCAFWTSTAEEGFL